MLPPRKLSRWLPTLACLRPQCPPTASASADRYDGILQTAPPPLRGPYAHGPPDVSLSVLTRPAAHASGPGALPPDVGPDAFTSGAAGEHGAGRSAIRRSRGDITWNVHARPRPETVRSIERGGVLVRSSQDMEDGEGVGGTPPEIPRLHLLVGRRLDRLGHLTSPVPW